VKYKFISVLFLCAGLFAGLNSAYAGGGHYTPGVMNLRDLVMPPKGFYYEQYNPYYFSTEYYDKNGNKLTTLKFNRSIRIFSFPIDVTATVDIDLKVQVGDISPTFIYSTGAKLFGANYGFYVSPSYGYTKGKLDIKVKKAAIGGITIKGLTGRHFKFQENRSGIGDLLVTPIWLDWSGDNYDIFTTYGFYAPVGRYDANHFINIGHGFWSHELLVGGAYYLDKQKATALILMANYEFNGPKEGMDLRPGQNLTFEYGISQYLSERLEVGISGYSAMQVTDDSGSDARNKSVKDYVHGVGAQLGYWIVKDKFNASLRYTHEYLAKDRFKGGMGSFNLTYVF
jgi:hypothetical protein